MNENPILKGKPNGDKDAMFFLVKSQRKVVDQNNEVWVRYRWTKSQDMAENLRFSCLRKPQF